VKFQKNKEKEMAVCEVLTKSSHKKGLLLSDKIFAGTERQLFIYHENNRELQLKERNKENNKTKLIISKELCFKFSTPFVGGLDISIPRPTEGWTCESIVATIEEILLVKLAEEYRLGFDSTYQVDNPLINKISAGNHATWVHNPEKISFGGFIIHHQPCYIEVIIRVNPK